MANLKGLESVVSQLREERTNLVNQLRHVDAALSVLGKLEAVVLTPNLAGEGCRHRLGDGSQPLRGQGGHGSKGNRSLPGRGPQM